MNILKLMAFTYLVFQTRDDTMRAFNEVSDLVSRQIVPAKQVK
jgi:hypothetical protein